MPQSKRPRGNLASISSPTEATSRIDAKLERHPSPTLLRRITLRAAICSPTWRRSSVRSTLSSGRSIDEDCAWGQELHTLPRRHSAARARRRRGFSSELQRLGIARRWASHREKIPLREFSRSLELRRRGRRTRRGRASSPRNLLRLGLRKSVLANQED